MSKIEPGCYVLMANSYNNVSFPILVFNTEARAKDLLSSCGGKPMKFVRHSCGGTLEPDPVGKYYTTGSGFKMDGVIDLNDEEVVSKLLTGYYGGCGEINSIEIKQVKSGVPFVYWDLD